MRTAPALVHAVLLARLWPAGGPTPPTHAGGAQAAVALEGAWELDLQRSHYGPGVDRRRRERFTCAAEGGRLACTIRGERADGRVVVGRFTVALDGPPAPVAGVPDVDAVRLRAVSPSIVDATFSSRGAQTFGYRAYRSTDGRTLTLVAVDPTSRAALTSVVVYRRAEPGR